VTPSSTLVLIRHGRTAWNAEGRFQGQADPPLDRTGWEQAADVALALRSTPLAAVLSSDLSRARQTAALVAAGRGLVVRTSDQLREVDLGTWTALTRGKAEQRFPGEYRAWHANPRTFRRGGGETEDEAGARVARFLRAAARSWPGETIAVVSHGLALRGAMHALRELGAIDLPDEAAHLDNGGCLTVVVRECEQVAGPRTGGFGSARGGQR
jgi:broad specificity phosphatase PhoE